MLCHLLSMLKCAKVCPIYKKGYVMDVANYRPISVLPNVSKVFEKELVNQLNFYFENIIITYVSGFRKRHCCETVL